MIRNKNINKVIFISYLLIETSANSKNFYTCLPKEYWVKQQCVSIVEKLKQKLKVAEQSIDNEGVWRIIKDNSRDGTLDMGIYKVVVKGGDGGESGLSYNGGKG